MSVQHFEKQFSAILVEPAKQFAKPMALSIHEKAPLFKLFNSEKELVDIENFRGQNVVLLFYPAAFTSTCTKELCSTRDELSFYNSVSAKVFAISTDSVYVLSRFKEELRLNFSLLSDFNKEVCGLYGAQYELFNYGMKGVAKRAAFVIDRDGIIRYAEVLEAAGELPDFNAIKKTLESLEGVRVEKQ